MHAHLWCTIWWWQGRSGNLICSNYKTTGCCIHIFETTLTSATTQNDSAWYSWYRISVARALCKANITQVHLHGSILWKLQTHSYSRCLCLLGTRCMLTLFIFSSIESRTWDLTVNMFHDIYEWTFTLLMHVEKVHCILRTQPGANGPCGVSSTRLVGSLRSWAWSRRTRSIFSCPKKSHETGWW